MRILFDSKQPQFKTPFGTLIPDQVCTLHLHIPTTVGTTKAEILLQQENGMAYAGFSMELERTCGAYDIYRGEFSLPACGLYFYYFRITGITGTFRLFKYGDDTNMEAGALWQVSCIPADFTTPDWAKGAVIYQLFPDRFHKAGACDLTGKLEPYTVHEKWDEEVSWQPTKEGLVLNNDFYGGNFKGITEKMDYLASLGVTILYLNPISKSFSSHRYDTGDYKTPDPMLGTEADFSELCRAAHARGIKVVLDGVYSHTGSNSLYFNRAATFPGVGAYQSRQSPYFNWFDFKNWPNSYTCWWNFDTLPTVNKLHPDFIRYIITDDDSVVAHWLALGADGFRLDVVDELPDAFVKLLKQRIRQIKPDALLIGEVWEDASNKIAYGVRRRYFADGILDSAMNYPWRQALLNYLRYQDDGRGLRNAVMTIAENYPPQVLLCNMNLLGTHDTVRILTALVDDFQGSRQEQACRFLTQAQMTLAKERLLMASFLQFMLPGAPSIYYADEAGMQGHKDPFNRRTYPWGRENPELLAHFRRLGKLRREQEALRLGDIDFFCGGDGRIGFTRAYNGKKCRVYCNRSAEGWDIPAGKLLLGHNLRTVAPDWLALGEDGFCVLEED
ncbi:MAG: glycoside hydrolase family 13 protein [Ruminococcaceae bacterium]|nr:glycoside hydrolase family 13 protein [Oscillospiraceae bacterium]